MNLKETLKGFKKNPDKIFFSTLFSVLTTLLFALYNGYLGLIYHYSFCLSIAIYYLCLLLARIVAILIERKIRKLSENDIDNQRKKTYIGLSIFMFFIDICLLAPIILLITNPKETNFGLIPSIVFAVYTTYKITMAVINYNKVKKVDNLIFQYLRELSVVDAFVSILSLQNTLIMVNSGMTQSMFILSAISSFVIFFVIVAFSIVNMVKTIKNK